MNLSNINSDNKLNKIMKIKINCYNSKWMDSKAKLNLHFLNHK